MTTLLFRRFTGYVRLGYGAVSTEPAIGERVAPKPARQQRGTTGSLQKNSEQHGVVCGKNRHCIARSGWAVLSQPSRLAERNPQNFERIRFASYLRLVWMIEGMRGVIGRGDSPHTAKRGTKAVIGDGSHTCPGAPNPLTQPNAVGAQIGVSGVVTLFVAGAVGLVVKQRGGAWGIRDMRHDDDIKTPVVRRGMQSRGSTYGVGDNGFVLGGQAVPA